MADGMALETPMNESLSGVSFNQLTCLFRHWTWADNAMVRFERELANGWEYDDDPKPSPVRDPLPLVCAVVRLQRSGARPPASDGCRVGRTPSRARSQSARM